MVSFGVRTLVFLAIVFVVMSPVVAQEWSAEQKEVWSGEVAYWKAVADRDLASVLAYTHDSYRGWYFGSALPGSKEGVKAEWSHSFPATKVFYHEVKPVAILVHGNTAVVHYILSYHVTNEKGEHETGESRWTDALIKEGGKWMLLGDHGGPISMLKE